MQMREREATRKYLLEFGGAMALYLVVLFLSLRGAAYLDQGFGRTLLLLSPMIPIALALWSYMRQLGRVDEYVRLRNLKSLALAGGITGGFSLTWGFLENAGFERLSMFTVWMVFGGSWAAVSVAQAMYCRFAAR
jgi:hypothetical protein